MRKIQFLKLFYFNKKKGCHIHAYASIPIRKKEISCEIPNDKSQASKPNLDCYGNVVLLFCCCYTLDISFLYEYCYIQYLFKKSPEVMRQCDNDVMLQLMSE